MPLEKLVQRILDDARDYGDRIVADAKVQRFEAMQKADAEAASKRAEILDAARQAAEMEKQQKVTAAVIKARKDILEAKQRIIAGVLDRAIKTIVTSPPEDYAKMLVAQLVALGTDSRGELVLSPYDRERVGSEVVERANRAIEEAGGSGRIALSDSTREMLGGFVLKTEDKEINSSLDAQIDARREEIEEAVVRTLFAERTLRSAFE